MLDARLTALSSSDVLAAIDRLAADGRELTADLVALLAVCDGRKLYATEGYESLFEFCVRRLRLSESQAYHRIQAARAARAYPLVLERLRAGRVTMTAVALLRDHLTEANHPEVLDWAEGRRKREVELFIRTLAPKPDVPSSLRRLAPAREAPALAADRASTHSSETTSLPSGPPDGASSPLVPVPTAPTSMAGQAGVGTRASTAVPLQSDAALVAPQPVSSRSIRRAEIHPLSPAHYSLHVTISQETRDKLRRAEDLLRHAGGTDLALVLDRALTLLVAQLERKKAGAPRSRLAKAGTAPAGPTPIGGRNAGSQAAVRVAGGGATEGLKRREPLPGARPSAPPMAASKPRRRSRYVPAAVRRAVWDRDGGSCAYVSRSGVRCGATAALEFHHRVPFAEGGEAAVANLEVRCTRDNQAEAERWFNFDQAEFGSKRSRNGRVVSPPQLGG